MYITYSIQTPSYKYTHSACNRMSVVHVASLVNWTFSPKLHLQIKKRPCPSPEGNISSSPIVSQDAPHFLKRRAHLCTGQCRREGVVTDGCSLLRVIHVHLTKDTRTQTSHICPVNQSTSFRRGAPPHHSVCKRSNHHCSGTLRHQSPGTDGLSGREGGGYTGAARRQVVRHWIFNHPQKFLRTVSRSDAQLVQQLNYDRM